MADLRIPDYQVAGESEVTVFLLHGGYGSKDYWRDEIEVLVKRGCRVVAWDAPGYGISPLPAYYSIDLLAKACGLLIEKTGTETNILLGHSMGGLIAPRVYDLFPDRVDALILSATVESLGHMSKEFQEEFIQERIAPLSEGKTLSEAAAPLVRSMMGPDSRGPGIDHVVEVATNTPTGTFQAAIRAIVEYDGREVLRRINVPTLCIAGELDVVGRASVMKEMADHIPEAEYVCIEKVGHYAWAEKPEEFNGELLKFLNRHELLKP